MKTVEIAAKTAARLVWRFIVSLQSPVEGGMTKFIAVCYQIEKFQKTYICYFGDNVLSLTAYNCA